MGDTLEVLFKHVPSSLLIFSPTKGTSLLYISISHFLVIKYFLSCQTQSGCYKRFFNAESQSVASNSQQSPCINLLRAGTSYQPHTWLFLLPFCFANFTKKGPASLLLGLWVRSGFPYGVTLGYVYLYLSSYAWGTVDINLTDPPSKREEEIRVTCSP